MADHPDRDALSDQTRRWVATVLGGEVVGVERFTRGRQAWWVDVRTPADGERRWMLKGRRAPASVIARSRLLTEFGPCREAAAIRSVTGTAVRVPRLGGFDSDSSSLLVERVPGSALLNRADPAQQLSTIRDYAQQLAQLHALDWRSLQVDDAIPPPADAEEMAIGGWLKAAEADARTAAPRLRHAEPLHELAIWWLHRHRPAGRGLERVRLLHGDAGVNNFLAHDGVVTALIDWELAILGDPMSDLGNARYREALYPTGTYAELVSEYERATGEPVDRVAVAYYGALAATVLSLGMVANVHHPRAGQPEAVARLWQDAIARCVACEAIAEASGVTVDYDDEPLAAESSFRSLAELMLSRSQLLASLAAPGQAGAETLGYASLARALGSALNCGAEADSRLLDDSAGVLGRRPVTVGSALAELAARMQSGSGFDEVAMLRVLARDARRRLEIMRPLQEAEVWDDALPAVTLDDMEREGASAAAPVLPSW